MLVIFFTKYYEELKAYFIIYIHEDVDCFALMCINYGLSYLFYRFE